MAVKPYTTRVMPFGCEVTWEGLQNGDTGAWFDPAGQALVGAQIWGVAGVGGAGQMQANPDAVTEGPSGTTQTAINFSSLTGFGAPTNGRSYASFFRPKATSGDGTTLVSVKAQFRPV